MSCDALRIWAWGDCHVGTDRRHGRTSLATPIRQSEGAAGDGAPAFAWDLALNIGDVSGGQSVPEDDEGEELVRQFGALQEHRREQIYSVCGNHDRSGLDEEPAWWFRKWCDPTGEATATSAVDPARRPYPVDGTWERYSFRVGNLLFLMMSDINEPSQEVGRGTLGGNPGGVVSGETFRWWRRMVEAHPEDIVVSVHHYMLKETTAGSGPWEGMRKDASGAWRTGYHGYKERGTPAGAGYLYWVESRPDAEAFESYLAGHPGATALWLGGHTHVHPDAVVGGKGSVETRWGTHFLNVGALTRHHTGLPNPPKSWRLTLEEGSDRLRVECYLHTDEFLPLGWYAPATRELILPRPFQRNPGGGA